MYFTREKKTTIQNLCWNKWAWPRWEILMILNKFKGPFMSDGTLDPTSWSGGWHVLIWKPSPRSLGWREREKGTPCTCSLASSRQAWAREERTGACVISLRNSACELARVHHPFAVLLFVCLAFKFVNWKPNRFRSWLWHAICSQPVSAVCVAIVVSPSQTHVGMCTGNRESRSPKLLALVILDRERGRSRFLGSVFALLLATFTMSRLPSKPGIVDESLDS